MDSKDKRKFENDDPYPGSVSKQRKVIGPSLPPPREADAANSETSNDDDDDDDDDFGPSLPPSGSVKGPVPPVPTVSTASSIPKPVERESQRDQWMLQPPSHSDWSSKVDPTQLRNRKFNTGKSATAPKNMDSSWVETPEERMRRLQDTVMGVAASTNQPEDNKGATKAKLMEDQIKRYKDMTGKNSRLETPGQAEKEDDDPSTRAFDREKDMAVASKISSAQRREMVKKAADYNTRFTKGNFL
ncbi:hypothetical protein E8E15_000778 [Penicillium rubens]|uniref:Pc16g01220 protein n=1 Tax=Penicillium rubens (strain ATCC 28089 / DSM 1075 / NRRL 1951 / Wisconsin 54-1255) TaxID=500485 RepID=B6H724_PENRW|nr:uncharacterized protein N7525_011515 [Penicillium rubens]CAP92792.1 Pc16g01220 [Penicillium rubens Wisconsin 54-1255]KAF3013331.1 hypothetical protein E8E15_000778 [Penicillium rubens]KAJ5037757.1 hypothetical protein NUH16_011356 [Penicillium rubens]KAJ5822231.1 hypothetical protein N7525_011515 [Penicillium rubens]KAJ5859868.1 hypothetical protein N7534_005145 [Penicillium rubens]